MSPDFRKEQQWAPNIRTKEREVIRQDIATLEAMIEKHTPKKRNIWGFKFG